MLRALAFSLTRPLIRSLCYYVGSYSYTAVFQVNLYLFYLLFFIHHFLVVSLVLSLRVSNHLVSYPSLVGERMSRGNKAISGHVPSFYLDDKDVHLLGNVLTTEDWICLSKREPSTHLLEEEMEGEEEVERERRKGR